jgi:predicted RNA-binding Zn ribbon-like protein
LQLDHDSQRAVDEAVALVNAEQEADAGGDMLATTATLAAFLDDRNISGSRAGTEAELRAMHRLRGRLRTVFELAVASAIVVRDGGLDRLRVCASPDCGSVFVDVSRNRSRRYCDTLCANRQHVAAYRQRLSGAGGAGGAGGNGGR